jgi:methyltransferase
MVTAYLVLLSLVGCERLLELWISKRHARAAFARGGVEYGTRHFRVMTVMHAVFLPACALEVLLLGRPFTPWLGWLALAATVAAQALRYWAITSLGQRWNVRVIVVDGEPAIRRGPYRFLRHPNYVAVVVELLALPLVHGAYLTAIAFSLANAALLAVRIRVEERALTTHCSYAERFGLTRSPT